MGDKLGFLLDSDGNLKGVMVTNSAGEKQVFKRGTGEGELDQANLLKLAQQKLNEAGVEYSGTSREDPNGNRTAYKVDFENIKGRVNGQIRSTVDDFNQQAANLESSNPKLSEYFRTLAGNLQNPNQPSMLSNQLMAQAEGMPLEKVQPKADGLGYERAASYSKDERADFNKSLKAAGAVDGITQKEAAELVTKLTDFVTSPGTSGTVAYSAQRLAEKSTKQIE